MIVLLVAFTFLCGMWIGYRATIELAKKRDILIYGGRMIRLKLEYVTDPDNDVPSCNDDQEDV